MSNIKLFEQKQIRSHWDAEEEQWYFSLIDVIQVLTDSTNARDYWFKMKIRVKAKDGLELSTICRQLKVNKLGLPLQFCTLPSSYLPAPNVS